VSHQTLPADDLPSVRCSYRQCLITPFNSQLLTNDHLQHSRPHPWISLEIKKRNGIIGHSKRNTKDDILKKVGNQTVDRPTLTSIVFFSPTNFFQWCPSTAWLGLLLKNILFLCPAEETNSYRFGSTSG